MGRTRNERVAAAKAECLRAIEKSDKIFQKILKKREDTKASQDMAGKLRRDEIRENAQIDGVHLSELISESELRAAIGDTCDVPDEILAEDLLGNNDLERALGYLRNQHLGRILRQREFYFTYRDQPDKYDGLLMMQYLEKLCEKHGDYNDMLGKMLANALTEHKDHAKWEAIKLDRSDDICTGRSVPTVEYPRGVVHPMGRVIVDAIRFRKELVESAWVYAHDDGIILMETEWMQWVSAPSTDLMVAGGAVDYHLYLRAIGNVLFDANVQMDDYHHGPFFRGVKRQGKDHYLKARAPYKGTVFYGKQLLGFVSNPFHERALNLYLKKKTGITCNVAIYNMFAK